MPMIGYAWECSRCGRLEHNDSSEEPPPSWTSIEQWGGEDLWQSETTTVEMCEECSRKFRGWFRFPNMPGEG